MTDIAPRDDLNAKTTPTSETAKAAAALRILRGANLRPEFGFDEGDAERLWGTKLAGISLAAVMQAADSWISDPANGFPTLAEFETLAVSMQRHIDHPRREATNAPCPECDGTVDEPSGWVELTPVGGAVVGTVRPCERCRRRSTRSGVRGTTHRGTGRRRASAGPVGIAGRTVAGRESGRTDGGRIERPRGPTAGRVRPGRAGGRPRRPVDVGARRRPRRLDARRLRLRRDPRRDGGTDRPPRPPRLRVVDSPTPVG